MRTQYQVVANNRMEALYHPSIPRLGSIKCGKRVIGLTGNTVPDYPKWWLIHVERESVKISWRRLRIKR